MAEDIPPRWFVEALSVFACEVYKNTMCKKPITRISLSVDYGYRIGIAPGTSIDVHTACGPIEVYSEGTPRYYGVFHVPVMDPNKA